LCPSRHDGECMRSGGLLDVVGPSRATSPGSARSEAPNDANERP
jgi:hypothetical protein